MSGLNPLEPKLGRMRRNNQTTVKVEEKRLQRLLDFIDARCQNQRFKLKKQIEDTQQIAEDTEEKKHKATLQLLKGYFEITSGRVRMNDNPMHEERMLGVLSEPSMLPIVPEVDPDVLAAPRSMYDRVARGLDTTRLPMLAPTKRSFMMTQAMNQPPKSITESSGSASTSEHNTKSTTSSSAKSEPSDRSTPKNEVIPANTPEPEEIVEIKRDKLPRRDSETKADSFGYKNKRSFTPPDTSTPRYVSPVPLQNGYHKEVPPQSFNGKVPQTDYSDYQTLNGHTYQKGVVKPTSKLELYMENEVITPRLGDQTPTRKALSRHSSLKSSMRRPLSKASISVSTMSLADIQPTRKQQAAHRLRNALKTVRVPR